MESNRKGMQMFTPQYFLDRVERFCDENKTSEAALLRKAGLGCTTLTVLKARLKENSDAGMQTRTQTKIVQAMEDILEKNNEN